MAFLRWVLAAACGIGLAGFVLILTVGKGFDAFRSADTGNGSSWLVAAIPVLLLAMLCGVFLPGARLFLHLTAAGVAAAAVGCIGIVRTNPGEGSIYLGGLLLWLLYYGLAVWSRA